MNKKILVVFIGTALSQTAFSAGTPEAMDIKKAAPNQYDCTVDELELYVTKRTENIRKASTLSTWEDFKAVQKKVQAGSASGSVAAKNSGSAGNADAEAIVKAKAAALKKSGSASGSDKKEPECNLFYDDMKDMKMPEMPEFPDFGGEGGGLDALKKLAMKQMDQLAKTFMEVLTAGFCKRMSTDYLKELGTDILDDQLNKKYGYTTSDISGGNFENQVLNDQLKKESGTSDGKLLNIMDTNLNDNRKNYMEGVLDDKLDTIEDDIIE